MGINWGEDTVKKGKDIEALTVRLSQDCSKFLI